MGTALIANGLNRNTSGTQLLAVEFGLYTEAVIILHQRTSDKDKLRYTKGHSMEPHRLGDGPSFHGLPVRLVVPLEIKLGLMATGALETAGSEMMSNRRLAALAPISKVSMSRQVSAGVV